MSMHIQIKTILVALTITCLLGCVSQPKEPEVSYVAPDKYSKYRCDDILSETKNVLDRLGYLDIIYDRHASNDAINRGIGAVIYLPLALFPNGFAGADHANYKDPRYPKLRGELVALKTIADQKECDIESFVANYYKIKNKEKERNGTAEADNETWE